jgi:hypothetical protein
MPKDYVMKPIKKVDKFKSLFFNEIDKTLRTESEKFISSGESIKLGNIKTDQSITYDYNSFGFRSDEFISEHNGEHILFAGCSETEGIGDNIDNCWSYMTYKTLSKEKDVSGFFNISRHGWGYDIILSNIMTYIGDYGKPDKIFILFPNIGRFYQWKDTEDDKAEIFWYVGNMPNSARNKEEDEPWRKKLSIEDQRSHFIVFTMLMKLFEEYCATNRIELYWSTWDGEDFKNYKNANVFKCLVKLTEPESFIKKNIDFVLTNKKTKKYWLKKRDGHLGYLFHYIWSQDFLASIDKNPDR